MIKNLHLIDFIKTHKNWEELLQTNPYCLTIKKKVVGDNTLVLFYYNQIKSDFRNPIVRESRGIILEEGSWKVLAYAFNKFGNYGEGYVDQVDFNTSKILEKVDGSLIKIWFYNGEWQISTMACIDAREASLKNKKEFKNYYELFMKATENCKLDWSKLNKDNTYIFELASPFNRVVVPHLDVTIYHTGTRNNLTLNELNEDIGVQKPKEYSFTSFSHIIEFAKTLPCSNEGYVVVDSMWRRVKIKSPAYVAMHHLHSNGEINHAKFLILMKSNEIEEFLNYFPEYSELAVEFKSKLYRYIDKMKEDIAEFEKLRSSFETRKEVAMWAKTKLNPHIMFKVYDNQITIDNVKDYIFTLDENKLVTEINRI